MELPAWAVEGGFKETGPKIFTSSLRRPKVSVLRNEPTERRKSYARILGGTSDHQTNSMVSKTAAPSPKRERTKTVRG